MVAIEAPAIARDNGDRREPPPPGGRGSRRRDAPPPAPMPRRLTLEQAVLAYEANRGPGYAHRELARHLYALQRSDQLDEVLFESDPDSVFDEYLTARLGDWMRRRQVAANGGDAKIRQFVAWARATDVGKRYVWGSLEAVERDPALRAAALDQAQAVVLAEVPGMLTSQVALMERLGLDTAPIERQFEAKAEEAFAKGREIGRRK